MGKEYKSHDDHPSEVLRRELGVDRHKMAALMGLTKRGYENSLLRPQLPEMHKRLHRLIRFEKGIKLPSAEVVKLPLETVGEGYRFDSDEILEKAKGEPFARMAILGELEDGTLWVSGNSNAGETLVLMERAKRHIVFGDEDD